MRYVVYGAGAVGGTIAARLHLSGCQVVAVARGQHLRALQRGGLRFVTPEAEEVVRLPAAGSAREAELRADDVVLLTVKGQDTPAALDDLAAAAPAGVAVVCAQNGVDNERQALRRFERVYGMLVYLPGQHLDPGVVQAFSAPLHGVLDVGRVPSGVDEVAAGLARDLAAAGFASRAVDDVMPWKRAKLLRNLGNAFDALLGEGEAEVEELEQRAMREALDCFAAAGLAVVSDQDAMQRMDAMSPPRAAGDRPRAGSSSWQSVARGAGIETDWLNGEVVLLGRLHGVETPVNQALQMLAGRLARDGGAPGSGSRAEIEALIPDAPGRR
jgi:2-dehydropantoate 2-reductase